MKIIVEPQAEDYVRAVVDACDGEVGGLGYCKRNKEGDFVIYEFVVLKQEVSSGSVDFDDEAQHEEVLRADKEGMLDDQRVSWHSHGKLGVFYSGTDKDAIKKYQASGVPYLLSLVYNRKGEVCPRLDIFDSSVVPQITYEESAFDYEVGERKGSAAVKRAKKDVKDLVSKAKPITYRGGGGYNRDWEAECMVCQGKGRRTTFIEEIGARCENVPCTGCLGTGTRITMLEQDVAGGKDLTAYQIGQLRRLKKDEDDDDKEIREGLEGEFANKYAQEVLLVQQQILDPATDEVTSKDTLKDKEWAALCKEFGLDTELAEEYGATTDQDLLLMKNLGVAAISTNGTVPDAVEIEGKDA